MYTIKKMAERSLKQDLLEEFLNFANKKLQIDQPYSVYFVDDKSNAADPLGKTAMYNPSTNSVYVYATNRHPKDILRSIAHELMHHKQNCDGRLDKTYGEGSDNLEILEREANEAGYMVREFEDGRKNTNEGKLNEAINPGKYEKCLPHQQQSGGICYPKALAPEKSNLDFAMARSASAVNEWTLKDIIAARKDLWVKTGNRVGENFDMSKNDRESVFERLEDPFLRKMVLEPYFFYKVMGLIKTFQKTPRPPDYQNSEEYKSYVDELMKTLLKVGSTKAYKDLLLKFAGTSGFELSAAKVKEIKKLRDDFNAEFGTEDKAYKDAIKQVDYITVGGKTRLVGPKDSVKRVRQGSKTPVNIYQKILNKAEIKEQKEGSKPTKTIKRFEVYTKPQTDAAYMLNGLSKEGKKILRIGVFDDEELEVSYNIAQELLKRATAKQEDTEDVITKAAEIYGVSPLSQKSARAINRADEKALQKALIVLSVIGAIPLPGFWIADLAIAAYHFNKVYEDLDRRGDINYNELANGLLSTGFGMFFSRAPRDLAGLVNKMQKATDAVPRMTAIEARINALSVVDGTYRRTERALTYAYDGVASLNDRLQKLRGSFAAGDRASLTAIEERVKTYSKELKEVINSLAEKRAVYKAERDVLTEVRSLLRKQGPDEIKTAFQKIPESKFSNVDVAWDNYKSYLMSKEGNLYKSVERDYDNIRKGIAELKSKGVENLSEAEKGLLNKLEKKGFKTDGTSKPEKFIPIIVEDYAENLVKQSRQSNRAKIFERDYLNLNQRNARTTIKQGDIELNPEQLKVLEDHQKAVAQQVSQRKAGEQITTSVSSPKDIAEAILRKSSGGSSAEQMADSALQEIAIKVEAAGRHEVNEYYRLFSQYADESLPTFSKNLPAVVRTGVDILKPVISPLAQKGLGIADRIYVSLWSGNGVAKALQRKIAQFVSKAITISPRLQKSVNFLTKIFIFKFHWPFMIYARFYKPFCGTTPEEFTKYMFQNPRNIGVLVSSVLTGIPEMGTEFVKYFLDYFVRSQNFSNEKMRNEYYEYYDPRNENAIGHFCKDFIKKSSSNKQVLELVDQIAKETILDAERQTKMILKGIEGSSEFKTAKQKVKAAEQEVNATVKKIKNAKDPAAEAQKQLNAAQKILSDATSKLAKQAPEQFNRAGQQMLKGLRETKQKVEEDLKEYCRINPRNTTLCKQPKKRDDFETRAGEFNESNESISISNHLEKILEERLIKLTIGLIK